MNLTVIYNLKDTKLSLISYSQAYRDQWLALVNRFDMIQHITQDCSAKDINGDVIIFYDPHSTHHVKIDGIAQHKALKYSYMDDPHQYSIKGRHRKTNEIVSKLGAAKRIQRAIDRGIDYIICPYTESYYKHFGHLLNGSAEKMFVWFPVASDIGRYTSTPILKRKPEVLANGALNHLPGFRGYEFRKWAFRQPEVSFVEHCKNDTSVPRGLDYPKLLLEYAGALALCDTHTPPKYTEIPMAGCVCFAQHQKDYERMGFKDGESCIYVNKKNFAKTIKDFKNDISAYQDIADKGKEIVSNNWTSWHFADFIYEHVKEHL